MISNSACSIPAHLSVVYKALTPTIKRLRAALLLRTCEESGEPQYFSFEGIMEDVQTCLEDKFGQQLVPVLQLLGDEMRSAAASEKEILSLAADLDPSLEGYIEGYRAILRRPFPERTEPGRFLLAAMLERPLRDILGLFEQVRLAIRDPAGAGAAYGAASIELTLVLEIDREAEAFMMWFEDRPFKSGRVFRSVPLRRDSCWVI